jgi:small-conductance mechanosensitive channel
MESFRSLLEGVLTTDGVYAMARAVFVVIAGFVAARLLARAAATAARTALDAPRIELARRVTYYGVLSLFLAAALHQLGFNLNVLLGAAGVLTVAVGFASQTAASNLVSGLFLIAEHPFHVGDVIQVADTTGEVLAIDLLAVKLRTFDNQFVRMPNETLIKTEVRTLTKFPIRRADLHIGVAYGEDLDRVREVLLEVADRNPMCLDEPKPLFLLLGFGDSAVDVQFSVWVRRESFYELRTGMYLQVKQAFDRAGIEIPFPHRSLYAGSHTEPLPIRVVADAREAAAASSG